MSEVMNRVAEVWAGAMWRATWQGGLGLLVVWGLCVLVVRESGRVQSWLWRAGYLKMLICLLPVGMVGVAVLPAARVVEQVRVVADGGVEAVGAEGLVGPMVEDVAPVRVSSAVWLMGVWGVGVGACCVWVFLAWRNTRAVVGAAREILDRQVLSEAREVATGMGVRAVPVLRESGAIVSPLLTGVWRPVLLLPTAMVGGGTGRQRRLIFAHEFAHCRRHDLGWNVLWVVARGVFFFHPMVWLTGRAWQVAQEMACDRAALEATGAGAAEFGAILVETVARGRRVGRLPRMVGVGAVSVSTVQRRLKAMKNLMPWSGRRVAVVAGVVAVAGVVGMVPWRVVAQQPGATGAGKGATVGGTAGGGPLISPPGERGTMTKMGVLAAPTAQVAAPIDGVLTAVQVKEGQKVRKGDVLFSFDDRELRAKLALDETRVKMAENKMRQVDDLRRLALAQGNSAGTSASGRDVEQASLAYEMEKSVADADRAALQALNLVAPLDGVVGPFELSVGEFVTRGKVLTKVVAVAELRVDFYLAAAEVPLVKVGQTFTFTLGSERATAVGGEVSFIDASADAASGTVLARGRIAGAGEELKPGMSGVVILDPLRR